MGRYRRGHKYRKRGKNRNQGDDSFSNGMNEADLMLVENYLLEYRSRAYDACRSSRRGGSRRQDDENEQLNAERVTIGKHKFPPLTAELCRRPYVELPDTLSGHERRAVHSLCASLDLYHDSVGGDGESGVKYRKIVISIYADGLEFAPDIGSSDGTRSSFPSRTCRPWYHRACGSVTDKQDDNPYLRRKEAIEKEKNQIRKFVNLPEQSVRIPSDEEGQESFSDVIDFAALDSLDLSTVPSVEQTPWSLVDSVDKLKSCADELVYGANSNPDDDGARILKIHELAFDLEMQNDTTGTRTCLLQLTSDAASNEQSESSVESFKDFVIDPLAPGVWDAIPVHLGPLFSDPNIVKIGHGIGGMDTCSLHRDFGILVVNAFDTYEASNILSRGKGGLGLATLCRHYGLPDWEHYKKLKGKYQNSDWKRRPLGGSALEYGRYDIRYLITLRKLLMRDLAKLDMLGSGFMRFSSSLGDDSGVESSDLRLDSTVSSAASSFSEYEANNIDTSKADESNDASTAEAEDGPDDVFADSLSAPLRPQPPKSVIHASEFPCYHHLMQAFKISQKRSLKLWTGDPDEPILQNHSLLLMIKQAANQKGHGKYWTDANMKLYRQLAEWRANTARRECMSAPEVCSLDFLVHVAYKLPLSRPEMRRFSYILPALLEDDTLPHYKELRDLVTSSEALQVRQNEVIEVVFYSEDRDVDDQIDDQKGHKRLLKLVLVSAAVAAIAITVTRVRKR